MCRNARICEMPMLQLPFSGLLLQVTKSGATVFPPLPSPPSSASFFYNHKSYNHEAFFSLLPQLIAVKMVGSRWLENTEMSRDTINKVNGSRMAAEQSTVEHSSWQGVWEHAFRIFERQVLVFPLLVVLLTCVSFLFGGRCAAWQWCASVAIVAGVPFVGKSRWREAITAGGLFTVVLLAVKCLLPPLFWDNAGTLDMPVYHLPMAQMLVEGWNPVKDPLADAIMNSLGLDFWGMAAPVVVFYSKTMGVFSAVAYHFVGDPTALTIPGIAFLWLGVALAAIRLFNGFSRCAAIAAVILVLPMVACRMPVDLEVAFASCGLLFAMQDALRRKECDWLSLVIWCTWMMNLKHNAVLGAFVFCSFFMVAKCWREREKWKAWFARFLAFAGILVALWIIVSWNPLISFWKIYGHPLYPLMTSDADRFPPVALVAGQTGNADAQYMGKLGALAHAYVSPRLTTAFFQWKSGRDDFRPYRPWWAWKEFPTRAARVALWVVFAVLFIFPRGRGWGLCGVLLVGAMPIDQIGFTRYQPWLSALGCLAVVMVAEWLEARLGQERAKWASAALLGGLALMGGLWGWQHARDVEYKAREFSLIRERIRPLIWAAGRGPSGNERQGPIANGFSSTACNYLSCMLNRTRLLTKQMGREGKTAILPTPGRRQDLGFPWIERDWPDIAGAWRRTDTNAFSKVSWKEYNVWEGMSDDSDVEAWMREPFGCYWIPVDDSAKHVIEYYTFAEPREGETKTGRLWRRLKYCAKAWGKTYPREVCRWLIGRKDVVKERKRNA